MFVTGPDVVKTVTNETVTQEELGGAKAHSSKSGVAHLSYANDVTAMREMRELFDFLPLSNREQPPCRVPIDTPDRADPALDMLVPVDPNVPYDMKNVIKKVCIEPMTSHILIGVNNICIVNYDHIKLFVIYIP